MNALIMIFLPLLLQEHLKPQQQSIRLSFCSYTPKSSVFFQFETVRVFFFPPLASSSLLLSFSNVSISIPPISVASIPRSSIWSSISLFSFFQRIDVLSLFFVVQCSSWIPILPFSFGYTILTFVSTLFTCALVSLYLLSYVEAPPLFLLLSVSSSTLLSPSGSPWLT